MAKPGSNKKANIEQNIEQSKEQNTDAPVIAQLVNVRKGGSYVKDPKTGELTLVQATKRIAPDTDDVEKSA